MMKYTVEFIHTVGIKYETTIEAKSLDDANKLAKELIDTWDVFDNCEVYETDQTGLSLELDRVYFDW